LVLSHHCSSYTNAGAIGRRRAEIALSRKMKERVWGKGSE